jgi:hypothetical protein
MLKYHSHFTAHIINITLFCRYFFVLHPYLTRRGLFEQIKTAQKGRFPASRRADYNDLFAFFYLFGDVVKNQEAFKFFGKIFNVYHFYAASFPASREAT